MTDAELDALVARLRRFAYHYTRTIDHEELVLSAADTIAALREELHEIRNERETALHQMQDERDAALERVGQLEKQLGL